MKKRLALAIVATLAIGMFAGCTAPQQDTTPGDNTGGNNTGGDTTTTYEDGTHEGVGQGYGGEIRLNVNVEGGRITDIEVLEQQETSGLGDAAIDTVSERIIETQTTEVEVVTGATASSNGTMEAVRNALEGK